MDTLTDPLAIAVLAAVFLLAGGVKGLVGMGLPTLSLALLSLAFGLPEAMALLLVPSFVANIAQILDGGALPALLRRLWPFLLPAIGFVWFGAAVLAAVEPRWMTATLGGVLALYGLLGLAGLRPALAPPYERPLGVLAGAVNGVLTGMTGSFVVPGVLYLQAIGLPRDRLVQAMGLLFMASTLALAAALGGHGLLAPDLLLISSACVAPALLGMWVGRRLRHRLSDGRFRQVFFAAVLGLGLYILAAVFLAG
jgi:uncharacterized membrane protein YfcA